MKLNLMYLFLILALFSCDDEQTSISKDMMVATTPDMMVTTPDMMVIAKDMMLNSPDLSMADMQVSTNGIQIEGLSAKVDIYEDDWGIPHIQCAQTQDCFMVQGYLHAKNRFVQMDINRKFPQSRLGERVGALARSFDENSRLLLSTQDGGSIEDQMWASANEETKAMLEAYSKGVNAWLKDLRAGQNGARLSEEYSYPLFDTSNIEDWTAKDSLSVSLILIQQLTDDHDEELNNGLRLAQYGPDLYFDLYPLTPSYQSSILEQSMGKSLPQSNGLREKLQQLYQKIKPVQNLLEQAKTKTNPKLFGEDFGSNNWIVAPSKTESGKAMLANDPHLGLSNPSIWYITHFSGTDLNVAGVSLPGLPGIIIGRNDKIAWGMTTTYFDFTEVYTETLSDDGEGVIFNGNVVPFKKVMRTFKYVGRDAEQVEQLYVPHHGPVLSIDRENKKAITMRWTAQNADTDINFVLALARANHTLEAKEALKNITTIGQNIVVADQEGHIGWFPYNRLPLRPWANSEHFNIFPAMGDGSMEWGDYIPYEDLPQAYDPPQGYLATANNDMTGAYDDGDPTNNQSALQGVPASGHRHGRIVERLEAVEKHNMDSFKSIIADQYSLVGKQIAPVLLNMITSAQLDPQGALAYQSLSEWNYDCPSGMSGYLVADAMISNDTEVLKASAGCAVLHVLYGKLLNIFYDEIEKAGGRGGPYTDTLIQFLLYADRFVTPFWDDVNTVDVVESKEEVLIKAFNDAGAELSAKLGASSDVWAWGKLHTVSLSANLISNIGVTQYNNGPFVNGGGLFTVDVANPSSLINQKYESTAGASMRFTCELSTPAVCEIQLPGGQNHHRDDVHYDDLLYKWLDRSSIKLLWTMDEIVGLNHFEINPSAN